MTINKKKNAFLVDTSELVLGLHLEVVTDTPFEEELVGRFYDLMDHEIDYGLATTLGLGVVKNLLMEDDYYLYNASNDRSELD